MQIGVIIPTYNEAGNLPRLVSSLFALPLNLHLLVVDDNSPDGTGKIAEVLCQANARRMNVIHRPEKSGLGSATIEGIHYFLNQKADAIAQIDADLSHDPSTLIMMTMRLETCDLVLGSRYVRGGSVDSRWPIKRRRLSAWGNLYARTILKLPFRDNTSGYRLWRYDALHDMPLNLVRSSGYVFQVEMLYLAHRLKLAIHEVPMHFAERENGKTKMSIKILMEAALRIWQLPLYYRNIQRNNSLISTGKIESLKDQYIPGP